MSFVVPFPFSCLTLLSTRPYHFDDLVPCCIKMPRVCFRGIGIWYDAMTDAVGTFTVTFNVDICPTCYYY